MDETDRFTRALEDLEAAVASTSGARTLDALLASWRIRRLPALSDAIVSLSQRYDAVLPPIAEKTERARYERFLALVDGKRSLDVGPLLAELPGASVVRARDQVERLGVMEPDPRVARALFDHLAAARYTFSNTIWTGIFKELKRHGDVRTREALAALPPITTGAPSVIESMTRRIASAVAALPEHLPTSPEETLRLAKVTGSLAKLTLDLPEAAPKKKPAAPGKDEDALLAAIAADPDDVASRQVLADLYTERGDVRGELMALQLAPPTAKSAKREKQLLKEHLVALLGPIEPVVDLKSCRFSGGFLTHAEVTFETAAQRKELVGNPRFWMLESVETRELALIRHPALRRLRSVSGLTWKSFVELAEGEPVPHLERVRAALTISDPGKNTLEHLRGLPGLREVGFAHFGMGGVYTADAWSWLLTTCGGALAALGPTIVTDTYRASLKSALAELERRPRCPGLTFEVRPSSTGRLDLTMAVTRAPGGYAVELRSAAWPMWVAPGLLSEAEKVVSVTLHPPTATTFDAKEGYAHTLQWMRSTFGEKVTVVD